MAIGTIGDSYSLDKVKSESRRYLDNAKEMLKRSGKEGDLYTDSKYVSMATGTAYAGLLIMVQRIIDFNGLPRAKKEADVKYYQESLGKINKKLLSYFNSGYGLLHLLGYYRSDTLVSNVSSGFQIYEYFMNELDKISPARVEGMNQ